VREEQVYIPCVCGLCDGKWIRAVPRWCACAAHLMAVGLLSQPSRRWSDPGPAILLPAVHQTMGVERLVCSTRLDRQRSTHGIHHFHLDRLEGSVSPVILVRSRFGVWPFLERFLILSSRGTWKNVSAPRRLWTHWEEYRPTPAPLDPISRVFPRRCVKT
jgi:hypothetical protein